jgi:hypothetical protein
VAAMVTAARLLLAEVVKVTFDPAISCTSA